MRAPAALCMTPPPHGALKFYTRQCVKVMHGAAHHVPDAVGVVLAQHRAQAVVAEAHAAQLRVGPAAAAAPPAGRRKHAQLHRRAQQAVQSVRIHACAAGSKG